MKILHYENGDILAVGDITESEGVYTALNDVSDVSEYTLSGFGSQEFLSEINGDLPEGFNKIHFKFIENEIIFIGS